MSRMRWSSARITCSSARRWAGWSAVEKHVTAIFDTLGIERSGEAHRRILAVLTFLRAR
jgi:hypothetical protein